MVRVGDLRDAAIELDLAADDPLGADREKPLQVIALDVEIDQRQEAGTVKADYAVRAPAHARLVAFDLDL